MSEISIQGQMTKTEQDEINKNEICQKISFDTNCEWQMRIGGISR
jgi:hypothetical protein